MNKYENYDAYKKAEYSLQIKRLADYIIDRYNNLIA